MYSPPPALASELSVFGSKRLDFKPMVKSFVWAALAAAATSAPLLVLPVSAPSESTRIEPDAICALCQELLGGRDRVVDVRSVGDLRHVVRAAWISVAEVVNGSAT